MKIYLDNCCYNRPFDDQSQERIHFESEAILSILKLSMELGNTVVGSKVVELEISRISDTNKRFKVERLYKIASEYVVYTESIKQRSEDFQSIANIKTFDALHLASAESVKVDVFLSTDDKLIKASQKLNLNFRVLNPLELFMEVTNNE